MPCNAWLLEPSWQGQSMVCNTWLLEQVQSSVAWLTWSMVCVWYTVHGMHVAYGVWHDRFSVSAMGLDIRSYDDIVLHRRPRMHYCRQCYSTGLLQLPGVWRACDV